MTTLNIKHILTIACAGSVMLSSISHTEAAVTATGDVAIIGMSTDSTDSFSWVPLVDISSGQSVYFSDAEYITGSGFTGSGDTGESLIRFTAATDISAGTVHTYSSGTVLAGSGYSVVGLNTQFGAYSPDDGSGFSRISLASGGDELIAFISSDDPFSSSFGNTDFTPLFQIDTGHNAVALFTNAGGSHETELHPGLTLGVNAVGLRDTANNDEFDNIRYMGPTSGTRAQLLAAISNQANWEGDQSSVSPEWTRNSVTQFNVTPEPSSALLIALGSFSLVMRRRRA